MRQKRDNWNMTVDANDKSSYAHNFRHKRSHSEPPNNMSTYIMNEPFIIWFYKKWYFSDAAGPITSQELLDMYNNNILTDSSTCWRAEMYAPKTIYKITDIVVE